MGRHVPSHEREPPTLEIAGWAVSLSRPGESRELTGTERGSPYPPVGTTERKIAPNK
jgi:hypothetical protein